MTAPSRRGARRLHSFGGIPRAAVTIGAIDLLGLVVPWFLPETRGRPLPA